MSNIIEEEEKLVLMKKFMADDYSSLGELFTAVSEFAQDHNVIVHNTHFATDSGGESMTIFYESLPTRGMLSTHQKIFEAMFRWLEIKERFEQPRDERLSSNQIQTLKADLWHSSLLARLLNGKNEFVLPPPRANSYPWYSLVEHHRGQASEVYERAGGTILSVEQYDWKIERKVSDTEYVISYEHDNKAWYRIKKGDGHLWNLEKLIWWPIEEDRKE